MCYPDEARPPDHGLPGKVASAADLVLTAGDGNQFAAHVARPESPSSSGIVILPDVRGLHNFYRGLAVRFAEAGHIAIAIDYFGRTAGVGPRGDDFDHQPHRAQTAPATLDTDVAAAIAHLRAQENGNLHHIFSVGFCFGGANSWRQSASQTALSGAIGFYGVPQGVRPYISQMKAPLLLLIAGADMATPQEDFERFDRELTEAGVSHHMIVYPGAPHSFFDRGYEKWQDACRDCWRQVLDFVRENSAAAA
jgi:carboxymethylenebutenolidase